MYVQTVLIKIRVGGGLPFALLVGRYGWRSPPMLIDILLQ